MKYKLYLRFLNTDIVSFTIYIFVLSEGLFIYLFIYYFSFSRPQIGWLILVVV